MADDHLQREEDAGDRRVERGRDGGGDPAAEKRPGERSPKMQFFRHPSAERGAEMNDRSLPAGRGTGTD